MPLYEYLCEQCDERFDRLVTMSRADDVSCPSCGELKPKRLLSVIAGLTGRATAPMAACGMPGGCADGPCGAC